MQKITGASSALHSKLVGMAAKLQSTAKETGSTLDSLRQELEQLTAARGLVDTGNGELLKVLRPRA